MSELKRVFFDRSRVAVLVLLTVFCIILLGFSFIGSIGPKALKNNIEAKNYTISLINKYRNTPSKEIAELLSSEIERLSNISSWISGMRSDWFGFQSEQEYSAAISDYPYLKSLSGNDKEYNRAYSSYIRWLSIVKTEALHQSGYKDYLTGISDQADKLSQISIFGNANSFSNKNIIKTAQEFSELEGIETVFGNNLGLELWLDFSISDYLFVGGILVIVLAFFEERKKGLWSIIRSCPDGRIKLGASRLLILSAGSVLCTILFCFLPLALLLCITGGWEDLNRSLQSLASFKTSTLAISISGWLIRYFIIKIVSGIAIGLVIWCILGTVTNPQFSLSVLGVIFTLEYALYELLSVQSFANIFKYFNIFSYIHLSSLYTNYLNINLFGNPIGIRKMMFFVLPFLMLLTASWAMLIQTKRCPEGNKDILGRLSVKINKILDLTRIHLTMGGWELYKAFIFGFGAIIALAVFVFSGSLNYSVYINEPDTWYQAYLKDAEGEINEKTDEYFALARKNALDDGKLLSSLARLETRISELKQRSNAGGYAPWLVDEKVYSSYFGEASKDRQSINAAASIIFLILLSAGIAAYERQSGVTYMVRSLKNGRGQLVKRKALVCILMAIIVWANVYMRELLMFLTYEKPITLAAPVQNIESLSAFPLRISLGQYLAILYATRLCMLILTSFVILLISGRCKNVMSAYIVSLGTLGFPALLVIFGAEVVKYVSPIIPISSAEILWSIGNKGNGFYENLTWVAMTIVGIGALAWHSMQWAKSK